MYFVPFFYKLYFIISISHATIISLYSHWLGQQDSGEQLFYTFIFLVIRYVGYLQIFNNNATKEQAILL